MPEEKTHACLECGTDNPMESTTCSACGGGSFQRIIDHRHEEARDRSGEPHSNDLAAYTAQMQAKWDAGERPEHMCDKCPSPNTPCRDCYARAGYDPAAYDERFLPGPKTLPEQLAPTSAADDNAFVTPTDVAPQQVFATDVRGPAEVTVPFVEPSTHPSDPPGNHDGDEPDLTMTTEVEPDGGDVGGPFVKGGPVTSDESPHTETSLFGIAGNAEAEQVTTPQATPTQPSSSPKTGSARGKAKGSK